MCNREHEQMWGCEYVVMQKKTVVQAASFVLLCTLWTNQSSHLLLSVDSQTSAGNRKLYNKNHEQDDHVLSVTVKEQQQWTRCRHWTCMQHATELIHRNISANSKKIESVCKVHYCLWNTIQLGIFFHINILIYNEFSKTVMLRQHIVGDKLCAGQKQDKQL